MKSDTQARILDYIREMITMRGYAPTVREICTAVHIASTSTVHGHLAALEKRGFIHRDPTHTRGITLVPRARAEYKIVPVINRLQPHTAVVDPVNVIEYMAAPAHITRAGTVIAYYIKDDSFKVDNLREGDCVFIELGEKPHGAYYAVTTDDGEIVIIRTSQILDLEKERFISVRFAGRGLSALGAVCGMLRRL